MNLLASGISKGGAAVILALCIGVVVLLLVNAVLVITLHKMNAKLAKKSEIFPPEQKTQKD